MEIIMKKRIFEIKKNEKYPVLFIKQSNCCGCTACLAVCPQGAISMQNDINGFSYPYLNPNKCIKCQKCIGICPLKRIRKSEDILTERYLSQPLLYGAKHREYNIVRKSSSGGIFTALSDVFLENGGGVCCCQYHYQTNTVEYTIIKSKEERDKARGSKYIQSKIGDIFLQCFLWLQENHEKSLLFVGLGCQVEGFRKFAKEKGILNRVFLVDLICHGQSSEQVWQDYVEMLENKTGAKVEYVDFKDKRNGWENPTAYVKIEGKEYSIEEYTSLFYRQICIRPSCFECKYTKIKRKSDITIGDFWGVQENYPDFYEKMGTSLVIVQSVFGRDLLEQVKDQLYLTEVKKGDCLQPRLMYPATKPQFYDRFWVDYHNRGMKETIKKYEKEGGSGQGRIKTIFRNVYLHIYRILDSVFVMVKKGRR